MKMKNKFSYIHISLILLLLFSGSAKAKIYAIKNATIIPVTSDTIKNGTLIIEGEKISNLGMGIEIPPDAEIIDGTGLFVYPGMIDASTVLGVSEIGSVPATQDVYELGDYNPHIRASVAINPHSVHIPITRVVGITTALVVPGGGVISGQCALINLNGWTQDEMLLKASAGIYMTFPQLPTREGRFGRRMTEKQFADAKKRVEKQIKKLKELFAKARRYLAEWESFDNQKTPIAPEKDVVLDALIPVIKRELPLIIGVEREKDIKNAIDFVKEQDVKAIFQGVSEGWKVAKFIAKANIPVLVGPVLRTPGSKDPYDARYANASILYKAGVKFAFITRSASDVRSLPFHAGTAAAFGLPKEEALKGVTIYPAQILGVADKIGSLEKGKLANVVVTDGDILQMKTHVKHLFIKGVKVLLESKHTKLYEKFRRRPRRN